MGHRHWRELTAAMLARDAPPASLLAELELLESAVTIEGPNAQAFALMRALCSYVECEDANEESEDNPEDEGRQREIHLRLVRETDQAG
jgi:hypothetical protein